MRARSVSRPLLALLACPALGSAALDARAQEAPPAAGAEIQPAEVPFGSRGWTRHGGVERFGVQYDDVYFNAEHGLFVMVPAGWTVEDEAKTPPQILWVMGRTDESGGPQSMVAVITQAFDGSGEAFFRSHLANLERDSLEIEGASRPKYRIEYADRMKGSIGMWEIGATQAATGDRSQRLYMARNGLGYTIAFQAAADASPDDVAELQALRRAMGF
ncbi:MAG TPA: hypothetical protein VM737_03695 [Gemmatimonadota bacterium]|nr:hypothetical protein [Gemmatimonadota bacterium]